MRGAVLFAMMLAPAAALGQVDCVQRPIRLASACGIVLDRDGVGVPRAQVVLISKTGQRFETSSDETGHFDFDFAGDSAVNLHVEAKGFDKVEWDIKSLKATDGHSCSRPIYIVLDVARQDCSIVTTKRKDLPKVTKR